MKKLVAILALCLTCVFCLAGLTACGDDKPDNANQNEQQQEQGQTEQGGAVMKAQLSASYKLVAKTAWAKLGFENVLEEKNAATLSAYSASFPETGVKLTEGTFNWAALRGNAGASVALINMIGDYYKNENFVITDKVVSFEIEDVHYSSSGQMRIPSTLFMRPKIDMANNKVEVELRIKNEQYDNYYYFDLGFDFETETLEYFVFGLHVMGTYSMQKMDTNGDFYFANDGGADGAEMLPSAEFKAEVDRLETDFKTAIADGLTLTGDFQSEYDNFGTISSKIFFESVNSVSDQGNGSGNVSQKPLTKEEFLTWLEEAQTNTFNDESKHYATVSGTLVNKSGGNNDGTFSGTFALTYSISGQGSNKASAIVKTSDSSSMGIGLLGSSDMIERTLTQYPDGKLTIKQEGENIDVKFEFENEGHDMLIHYVYDKDGYVIYRLEQMGDGSVYKIEFTATAYNK